MSSIRNSLRVLGIMVFVGLCAHPLKASAQGIQFFPPLVPGTKNVCPPSTAGYSYSLVWDGVDAVECAKVPTSCPAGEGLQFDGANFNCVVPCSGPTQGFITQGTCPSGEVGQIGIPVTVSCDGTETQGAPENTCTATVNINTTSQSSCPIGSTVTGQLDGAGTLNSLICLTNPSACSTYVCTAGGLVPQ